MDAPPRMRDYYQHIVALTRRRDNPDLLRSATDEVFQRIVFCSEINIEIAAINGHSSAYVFLYAADAMYRGSITLHEIIQPAEVALKSFREHKIEPILERLSRHFDPFEVQLEQHIEEYSGRVAYSLQVRWKVAEPEASVGSGAGSGAGLGTSKELAELAELTETGTLPPSSE